MRFGRDAASEVGRQDNYTTYRQRGRLYGVRVALAFGTDSPSLLAYVRVIAQNSVLSDGASQNEEFIVLQLNTD